MPFSFVSVQKKHTVEKMFLGFSLNALYADIGLHVDALERGSTVSQNVQCTDNDLLFER